MLDAWHDAVPPSPPKRVVGYLPQPADYCGFTPRKTQRNESAMNFRVLNADWPPQPLRWDLPPHTSTITIYRDILLSQNGPSGQRRRDVRQGHDGLRGWEKGDGTLREALPPRFMVGLVVGGLFLLFVAGPAFHFFPLLFLIWVVPFFLVPAFRAAARGLTGF